MRKHKEKKTMYELKKNDEVVGRYMTELDCEYRLTEIQKDLTLKYYGEENIGDLVEEELEEYSVQWATNEADWLLEWIHGCGMSRIQLRDIDMRTVITVHRHDGFRISAITIGPLHISVESIGAGYTNDCFRINDGTVLLDVARLELVE